MSLKTGLRTLLLNYFPVRQMVPDQVVGNNTFPCVFCEEAAQGVKPPYILIAQINHDPMYAMDGTSGLGKTEIDVDVYDTSHERAEVISTLVQNYLKDFSGLTPTGTTIKGVLWEDTKYGRYYLADGTDTLRRFISTTFTIFSQ